MSRIAVIVCCILPVVLTQPVGFTMTRGQKNGTYINFAYVATDINAELDQTVGAFRCSIPGLYYFTFSALSPQNDVIKVSLRKNRVPVTTIFASEKVHTTVSGSMVLSLKPNDIVYPYIEDGNIVESSAKTRALTSFSGFKISGKSRGEPQDDSESDAYLREADAPEGLPAEPDAGDKIDQVFKAERLHK